MFEAPVKGEEALHKEAEAHLTLVQFDDIEVSLELRVARPEESTVTQTAKELIETWHGSWLDTDGDRISFAYSKTEHTGILSKLGIRKDCRRVHIALSKGENRANGVSFVIEQIANADPIVSALYGGAWEGVPENLSEPRVNHCDDIVRIQNIFNLS